MSKTNNVTKTKKGKSSTDVLIAWERACSDVNAFISKGKYITLGKNKLKTLVYQNRLGSFKIANVTSQGQLKKVQMIFESQIVIQQFIDVVKNDKNTVVEMLDEYCGSMPLKAMAPLIQPDFISSIVHKLSKIPEYVIFDKKGTRGVDGTEQFSELLTIIAQAVTNTKLKEKLKKIQYQIRASNDFMSELKAVGEVISSVSIEEREINIGNGTLHRVVGYMRKEKAWSPQTAIHFEELQKKNLIPHGSRCLSDALKNELKKLEPDVLDDILCYTYDRKKFFLNPALDIT